MSLHNDSAVADPRVKQFAILDGASGRAKQLLGGGGQMLIDLDIEIGKRDLRLAQEAPRPLAIDPANVDTIQRRSAA